MASFKEVLQVSTPSKRGKGSWKDVIGQSSWLGYPIYSNEWDHGNPRSGNNSIWKAQSILCIIYGSIVTKGMYIETTKLC
jgi:hypothetical protein